MTFENLLDELKKKDLATREKYKGIRSNRLDGSPETMELRENEKWFRKEIAKLNNEQKRGKHEKNNFVRKGL